MMHGDRGSRFLRDVFYFSVGNFIALVVGYVQGFLIPKYLTIEEYAYWRWFNLFISYVGLLHLGLPDSFLLSWVRKPLDEVKSEIELACYSVLLLQLLLFFVGIPIILLFMHQPMMEFLVLSIMVYMVVINISTVFMFRSQALKQFTFLARLTVINRVLFVIGILILLAVSHFSFQLVTTVFCFVALLQLIVLIWPSWGSFQHRIPSLSSLLVYARNHFQAGIILVFGNFVPVIFSSTDRLFITSFFTIHDFAMYSFAVTLIGIIYVLIKSIANVVLPYVSNASAHQQQRAYEMGRFALIVLWGISLGAYYFIQALVVSFLPAYVESILPMNILVSSLGFMAVIQIIHTNYFKVTMQLKQYFTVGIAVLVFLVLLNLVVLFTFQTLAMLALANSVSVFCWYVANEILLRKPLKQTWNLSMRLILGAILYVMVFWGILNWIHTYYLQGVGYWIGFCVVTVLLFREEFIHLRNLRRRFSIEPSVILSQNTEPPVIY